MELELAGCLDPDRDAIQRAVRVEVGDVRAAGPGNAGDSAVAHDAVAVAVRVDCAAEGRDAGVVLEVRLPDSPRRYRYALDWRAQPLDARPRLLGLAVAEAVDASRIELTAIPEPAAIDDRSPPTRQVARAPSTWTIALIGGQRTFSARRGARLLGAGLSPTRRLSSQLRWSGDLIAEGATALTTSGAVAVQSLSAAARIVYRAGGRLHGELGLGGRAGIVRMRGEALPSSQLAATGALMRGWLGPAATLAVGADLSAGVAIAVSLELGIVASGATARDLGEPVATIGGTWRSLDLAITIAL